VSELPQENISIASLEQGNLFVIFVCTQGALLLLTADWMVHFIWKRGKDPDNVAIPYLTALGDLLGTGFLAAAFHILWLVGDRDADVGD
jgi:solute carrier family 41